MIRRWRLLSYFALACGISWLLWLPRIASEQGWTGWFVPEWWHYAGAAGPIVAASLVAARTGFAVNAVNWLSSIPTEPVPSNQHWSGSCHRMR